jgi:hypothetical protein
MVTMVTKERIEELIAKNSADLKTYKGYLNENYVYQFEWVAERVFKLEWKNDVLNYLLSFFNDKSKKNPIEFVERLRERYRNDLTTRTLMSSSTNPLANLASLWISECKQDLIADLS